MANTLNEELSLLTTRVARECRTLWTHVGDVTGLKTYEKSNLVDSINELYDRPMPTEVNDNVTSSTQTWSSSKLSTILGSKSEVQINDDSPLSGSVYSSLKTQRLIDQVGDWLIEDSSSSLLTTYSSEKILSVITKKIEESVGAAPELLNTISELANAIQNDPNFAVSIQNQLAKRVRVDGPSLFTESEKQIARNNIGAASYSDVSGIQLDLDGSIRGYVVNSVSQTRTALNSLFVTKSEAVSTPTSSTVMRRDASGRSQVNAPLEDSDVVNFQWAEGRYARSSHTHPEIANASTTPSANAIPKYNSSSRLTSANPGGSTDVVNYQTMSSWMGGKQMWFGTETQYNAIPTKDVNTVYFLIS